MSAFNSDKTGGAESLAPVFWRIMMKKKKQELFENEKIYIKSFRHR